MAARDEGADGGDPGDHSDGVSMHRPTGEQASQRLALEEGRDGDVPVVDAVPRP